MKLNVWLDNVINLRLMVKLCVALSNMLQLESQRQFRVSTSDIEVIKVTFELKA